MMYGTFTCEGCDLEYFTGPGWEDECYCEDCYLERFPDPRYCPGCYHNGVLTQECGVYKEYGNGEHWFIQPADGGYLCDFCNAFSPVGDDLWS